MATERRRNTTSRQLELLVEFVAANRDLALGRVRSRDARGLASRLWEECAAIINAEGPFRTPKEWAKVWNDLKCKVKAKLLATRANVEGTGGGPSVAPTLSATEELVADIIGRDIGPLSNVRMDNVPNVPVIENDVITTEDHLYPEQEVEMVYVNAPALDNINNMEADIVLVDNSPPRTHSPMSPATPLDTQPTMSAQSDENRRRRIRRRRVQRNPQVHEAQRSSSQTVVDEARATIAQLELVRAQTELRQAEANLMMAQALQSIAQSFAIIARSMRHRRHRQIISSSEEDYY